MASKGSAGKPGPKVQRTVSPNAAGGWRVDAPGSKRASAVTRTKREAEVRAKDIVRREGGGEVRFRDRQGRYSDSDTVKPGRDPFPPRDTKR